MITDFEVNALNKLEECCESQLAKKIVENVNGFCCELDEDYSDDENLENLADDFAQNINRAVDEELDKIRNEKRKIGNFEVITSFIYGDKEIFLGEDREAKEPDERFVVGDCVQTDLFERYENCICGDDYNAVVKLYSERMNEQIQKVQDALDKIPFDRTVIQHSSCDSVSGVDLRGKVIVIDSQQIKPEYAGVERQLYVAISGFGCSPDGRGRKVYCTNLYSGKEACWYRSDILGTIKPECMPAWATERLAELEQGKSVDDIISNATQTCEEVNKDVAGKAAVELEKE